MSVALDRLVTVMVRLRDRTNGCPWDVEQNFKTIAPCTLEEAYEVVEAIENGDPTAMQDELGDLLFQVAFHAQMAREAGLFDLDSIATHVTDKMIERHPHVFGDRDVKTAAGVAQNWETDKEAKRSAQSKDKTPSVLEGICTTLPAATRAVKLQKRAARVGFDWADAKDVLAKIREEITELEHEININADKSFLEDDLGDVFFAITNLARKLDIDPETALRRTNRKFEHRFQGIEATLTAQGRSIMDASLDEMERIWNEIKAAEKSAPTQPQS